METFSVLLALRVVTGEFPSQRPVTHSMDVFFDLCPKKWSSQQWRPRWFETPPRYFLRHCNVCDTAYSYEYGEDVFVNKNSHGHFYGICKYLVLVKNIKII